MTTADIRAQERRQREIDAYCNMARSRHLMTYRETKVRAWVWLALAVLVVGLAVLDGGVWW
jgi:hypothetical protein